jgi:predicted Zn finger-like uncharacterized protein
MPLVIQCPQCATRYQVADGADGKIVRCGKCGNSFTAAVMPQAAFPAPLAANAPLDPSFAANAPLRPTLPQTTPQLPAANSWQATGQGTYPPSVGWQFPAPPGAGFGVSNPSGGPTDSVMRIVCGGMLALGLVLCLASLALVASQGFIFLAVPILAPLAIVLGVTGLISPNVVRAVGKYGGHLPRHYKTKGLAVMAVTLLLMILFPLGILFGGFRPDRPGGGNRGIGPTRAQEAQIMERIQASYDSAPEVVQRVSFPVFSINGANPAADAERVLGAAPGYVAGSFQISADRKKIAFQYRGGRDAAIPYALLLPGPTGIFVAFTPEFQG